MASPVNGCSSCGASRGPGAYCSNCGNRYPDPSGSTSSPSAVPSTSQSPPPPASWPAPTQRGPAPSGWASQTGGPSPARRVLALGVVAALVIVAYLGSRSPSLQRDTRATRQPVRSLADQMYITTTDCFVDRAKGWVRNDSDQTVSIFIDVQFLDASGRMIDNGIDSASHVRPREVATWEANMLEDGAVARCRADVSSVYPD
jgi:hypothetical protein